MADPAIATSAVCALGVESSWGTPATDTKKIPIVSESITGSQSLIDNPSIRGDFNPVDPALGKKVAGGSLVLIPGTKLLGLLAKWLTGNSTPSGAGPYVHVSKLENDIPPGMSFEAGIDIGGVMRYVRAVGLRINTFSLDFSSDGFFQVSIDTLGKNVSIDTASLDASPTDWLSDTPLDHLKIASAEIEFGGGVTTAVQKGSIQIAANLMGDDYRVGGGGSRGSLLPGLYTISGTLTFAVESTALLATLDSNAATAFRVKWASDVNTYFEIDLGRVFLDRVQPTIQGPGLITVDANFRGVYNTSDGTALTLTTGNDVATY